MIRKLYYSFVGLLDRLWVALDMEHRLKTFGRHIFYLLLDYILKGNACTAENLLHCAAVPVALFIFAQ